MKAILLTFLSIISLPAVAEGPQFLRIQPDQSSYEVGAKAIVFGYIDRLPTEPTKEFFVTMRVGGEITNAIRLSDRLVVALPKRFEAPGSYAVESSVFLQDKAEFIQLGQSVAFYQKQIDALLRKLENEQDSEGRELLEIELAAFRQKHEAIQLQMAEARALVEVRQISVLVNPVAKVRPLAIMDLAIDRDPAVYSVGESAIFTAHLNSSFEGPNGPSEPLIKGKIGTTTLTPLFSGSDFIFSSPNFSIEDMGSREFEATYFIRPMDQANTLRNASQLALQERTVLQAQLDSSVRPKERAYLEFKISELNRVIDAISGQLEEILIEIDFGSVEFSVVGGGEK